jgi:drug/metabolite transporter (DMT)-like permease
VTPPVTPPLSSGYLLAGVAALLWGTVVICIKLARAPGRVGLGVSLATAALVLSALAGRDLLKLAALPPPMIGLFLLVGCLQFMVGIMLYYEAIQHGCLSVIVPITRAKIVLVLAFSIALGLEHFRWLLLAACLLVLGGGVMLGWQGNGRQSAEGARDDRGVWLALLGCVAWGISETLFGKLPKDISPLTVNAGLVLCGLVSYLPYSVASGTWRQILALPRRDWLCYIGHGLVSLSAAYVLFVRAVQIAGPPRVSVVTSVYPLISAAIGWVAFHERLNARVALGAALLFAGVAALQFL